MNDDYFMGLALDKAREAFGVDKIPVGAALVINGELVDTNSRAQETPNTWFSHAENILIQNNAEAIRQARRSLEPIVLYSTLEPCIMCFGSAVHNRVSRIVYACPDPSAGSCNIKPPTEWYANKWPEIVRGPFGKESYDLFVEFMEGHPEGWKNVLPLYRKMERELL